MKIGLVDVDRTKFPNLALGTLVHEFQHMPHLMGQKHKLHAPHSLCNNILHQGHFHPQTKVFLCKNKRHNHRA